MYLKIYNSFRKKNKNLSKIITINKNKKKVIVSQKLHTFDVICFEVCQKINIVFHLFFILNWSGWKAGTLLSYIVVSALT